MAKDTVNAGSLNRRGRMVAITHVRSSWFKLTAESFHFLLQEQPHFLSTVSVGFPKNIFDLTNVFTGNYTAFIITKTFDGYPKIQKWNCKEVTYKRLN